MYFNNKNNFFHGIMFHHFHDDNIHSRGQGSITRDQLNKIIKFIGRNNIINANEFYEKFKKKKLKSNDVCFTFDDAIKSQIDVALPVLEDFKIKSFFFVYTSIFENKPDQLEIFRYFRMNYFNKINEFYEEFYKTLSINLEYFFRENNKILANKKLKYPNYSEEDLKFQLVRDLYLKKEDYEKIIFSMIYERNLKPQEWYKKLFFNEDDLIKLDKLEHVIGLHSHSHPFLLQNMKTEEQQEEYTKCVNILSKILNKNFKDFKCMSHPCGSYNSETLEILKSLGIELGFKEVMDIEKERGMTKVNNSDLEIARRDHAVIIREIEK